MVTSRRPASAACRANTSQQTLLAAYGLMGREGSCSAKGIRSGAAGP